MKILARYAQLGGARERTISLPFGNIGFSAAMLTSEVQSVQYAWFGISVACIRNIMKWTLA